jgi:hypothetical protein
MKKLVLSMALVLSAGNLFGVVSQPVKTGGVKAGTSSLPASIQQMIPGTSGFMPGSYEAECLQPMNIGGEAAREWSEKCDRMRRERLGLKSRPVF